MTPAIQLALTASSLQIHLGLQFLRPEIYPLRGLMILDGRTSRNLWSRVHAWRGFSSGSYNIQWEDLYSVAGLTEPFIFGVYPSCFNIPKWFKRFYQVPSTLGKIICFPHSINQEDIVRYVCLERDSKHGSTTVNSSSSIRRTHHSTSDCDNHSI